MSSSGKLGQLKLKGGERLTKDGVAKKKKKSKKSVPHPQDSGPAVIDPGTGEAPIATAGVDVMSGKTYEELFRSEVGKTKSTPWGSSYKATPDILPGYTKSLKGKKKLSATERLDVRSSAVR
jgi:hypothetical protein